MSDILKEPAFYRTLGALAQSLGKSSSYGAKAGAYGQQASEEWASRRAYEEAEKERKKKQKGGVFGDLGSIAGGALGTVVGGPVGGALGGAFGNAAGQTLGGGDEIDYSKVLGAGVQNAAPLFNPDAQKTVDYDTLQPSAKDSLGDYVTNVYGGAKGLTDYVMGASDRNAVSLNETLKMYPGQTEQSFLAQKQAAQRDDALTAQKQESAANAAYRTQQAGAAAKRLDLDERRYSLEEKRANKPDVFERINAQGGTERVLADPFTGAEQTATPLAPPKMDVHQGQGGYRTVNPYTSEGSVVDAPLPQPPQQPKFGVTNVGGALIPWKQDPTGQAQAGQSLYTAPQKPQAPIIRQGTYTNEAGQTVSGPMQYDAATNSMKPVAGTVGVPPTGAYQNPASVAKDWGTRIRKPWEELLRAGKAGPDGMQHFVEAVDAASKVETQIQDVAAQFGGIPPGVTYTTNGMPPGYVKLGFTVAGVDKPVTDPENPIYMPVPPDIDLRSGGQIEELLAAVATNAAVKGE